MTAQDPNADAETPWPDAGPPADQAADHAAPSEDDFEAGGRPQASGEALIVDVDGFEGPLDVLLTLAKAQKVDLAKISILALAEQYLAFVAEAKRVRLELAADYLVMAAWLTYLKSRLLLPKTDDDEEEPTGEELAARLQFQLQRLEAMREAAARLMGRNRLGRDVFSRGGPEPVRVLLNAQYKDTLQDLLKAYTRQRTKAVDISYHYERPAVYAIEDARRRIESMLGAIADWSSLESFFPDEWAGSAEGVKRWRTQMASTFTATLELVRDGFMEIRQLKQFGPVYVRKRAEAAPPVAPNGADPIPFPGAGPASGTE